MLRNLFKLLPSREALWLAPFLCIALIAFGLFRPLPHFTLPAQYRTVVDGGGTPVRIALPFRGIALTPTNFVNTYLEDTRSPELLVYSDKPSGVMSWIYPEVLKKDSLWNAKLFRKTASPYTDIEHLIAFDPSVYIGCGGPPDLVHRIGLPVFNCGGSPVLRQRLGLPDLRSKVGCGSPSDPMQSHYNENYVKNGGYYSENYLFPGLRLYSALIGHPESAETRIDAYCQMVAELQQELQPSTLASRPRVLAEGEDGGNLPRAGMVNANAERKIPGDDAERILVLDPDIILLAVGNPKDYMSEARWQGLKAVRERRVYRRPGPPEWWPWGVTFKPVVMRWMAEVAHPERLRPRVRQILRERTMSEFGYRFSDEQVDLQLHAAENSDSAGAERFTRDYRSDRGQEVSK
jgi:ABC-type Fe3+-hydroxamate transport system substrate-binding protein